MTEEKVEALLTFRRRGASLIGSEHITLLAAVDELGSLTKAAQAVGLNDKAAREALSSINTFLPTPAVLGLAGGCPDDAVSVTPAGRSLIKGYRMLEHRLERIAPVLGGEVGQDDPSFLLWSFGMKTSARNAFFCTVTDIRSGAVNAEVTLRLSPSSPLTAMITMDSLRDLELAVGDTVMALVKAPFIMLAVGDAPLRLSARNKIPGTITLISEGPVNYEITLDIGDGKSITAIITRNSALDMDLTVGDQATAIFDASHVILAV